MNLLGTIVVTAGVLAPLVGLVWLTAWIAYRRGKNDGLEGSYRYCSNLACRKDLFGDEVRPTGVGSLGEAGIDLRFCWNCAQVVQRAGRTSLLEPAELKKARERAFRIGIRQGYEYRDLPWVQALAAEVALEDEPALEVLRASVADRRAAPRTEPGTDVIP